jgi:ABC-type multidrug transport system fused ATPase/permease subunit
MTEAMQAEQNYSWLEVPKSIWHFLGKNKSRYVGFNVLLFVILFYELIPPLILGKVVDFFTHYHFGDSLNKFYAYVIFLGVSSIIVALIRLTSKNRLDRVAIAARTNARVTGFERLMEFSLQWHSNENSGNKIERINKGSDSIPQWVQLTNNALFPIATAFIGVLGVFLFLSPIFLVFLILYSLSFFGIEYIFNRKLERLSNELNRYHEQASGAYVEGTGNVLAIKALGAEKDLFSKVKQAEEHAQQINIKLSNTGIHKWYSFQTLNGIALMVFLLLVGHQLVAGLITVGYILTFFSYFYSLRDATNRATDVSNTVIQLKADLVRMMPIFLDSTNVKTGNETFPNSWQNIIINNGSFKYPSGQIGLADLNFKLNRNEKLGVAGLSGSGKSTLIKILLGLYELEQGEFKVGNKNYYDIAHEEITNNIAVVLQETELFNMPLRDNITFMRDVNPELLAIAIETANLTDVIAKLPQGLDTFIGERGYSLSGGERQRLGIARAVCKNAPILIFDEATSSLDSKTEQEIMEKLIKNFVQKTMLIIAHRLSTLRDANRIIVFENGKIVEEGEFAKLKDEKNSKFGQLYRLQHD